MCRRFGRREKPWGCVCKLINLWLQNNTEQLCWGHDLVVLERHEKLMSWLQSDECLSWGLSLIPLKNELTNCFICCVLLSLHTRPHLMLPDECELHVHQSKQNINLERMNSYTDGYITQTTLIMLLVALNVYLNVIFSFTPTTLSIWIWTPESGSSDLTQCWEFPLVGLRGFSLHWSEPKRLCHHSTILTLKIRTSTNYFPQIPLKRP